jgi:ATP-dependent Zn protease
MKRGVLLLSLLACSALLVPPGAFGAVAATESYSALLAQIRAGQVRKGVINKVAEDVKVTLKNGTVQEAIYPKGGELSLSRTLRAHGAAVKVAKVKKKKAAAHHHLRYIAAGVLAAVIIIGGGLWLIARRQQPVPPPAEAGAGGTPAGPPPREDGTSTTPGPTPPAAH